MKYIFHHTILLFIYLKQSYTLNPGIGSKPVFTTSLNTSFIRYIEYFII